MLVFGMHIFLYHELSNVTVFDSSWLKSAGVRDAHLSLSRTVEYHGIRQFVPEECWCSGCTSFVVTNCRISRYSTVRDWRRRIGMSSAFLFQQLSPVVSGTVSIFPGLCGALMFITTSTTASHFSQPSAKLIHFTSFHPFAYVLL